MIFNKSERGPMQDLSIIPLTARPDLADTCAAWSFGEWSCHQPGRTLEKTMERYRNTAAKETASLPKTWIGLAGDKIAGMISLKKEDHPDIHDLAPWVASFFIHPVFRDRGYARRFLDHVQTEAGKLNYKTLYLFTADAQNLYAAHGWKIFDRVRDPTGAHPHVVLMKKTL
ncbi:MAG: GNAT family N-acetyltransferase [Alphaproteobacteria bacterium]|nr:GNAT family N-acetyltransferase [Alphaproteobacteria bacterium]